MGMSGEHQILHEEPRVRGGVFTQARVGEDEEGNRRSEELIVSSPLRTSRLAIIALDPDVSIELCSNLGASNLELLRVGTENSVVTLRQTVPGEEKFDLAEDAAFKSLVCGSPAGKELFADSVSNLTLSNGN